MRLRWSAVRRSRLSSAPHPHARTARHVGHVIEIRAHMTVRPTDGPCHQRHTPLHPAPPRPRGEPPHVRKLAPHAAARTAALRRGTGPRRPRRPAVRACRTTRPLGRTRHPRRRRWGTRHRPAARGRRGARPRRRRCGLRRVREPGLARGRGHRTGRRDRAGGRRRGRRRGALRHGNARRGPRAGDGRRARRRARPLAGGAGHGARRRGGARPGRPRRRAGRGRRDRLRPAGLEPGARGGLPRRGPRQPLPAHRHRGQVRGRAGSAAGARRVDGRARRHGRADRRRSGAGLGRDDAPRRPVPAAGADRAGGVPARRRGADGGDRRTPGAGDRERRERRGRRGRLPLRNGPPDSPRPVRDPGPDAGGRGRCPRRR